LPKKQNVRPPIRKRKIEYQNDGEGEGEKTQEPEETISDNSEGIPKKKTVWPPIRKRKLKDIQNDDDGEGEKNQEPEPERDISDNSEGMSIFLFIFTRPLITRRLILITSHPLHSRTCYYHFSR